MKLLPPNRGDLFHLERVASILDSPPCYGIRLEFLDLEMTKAEQLAFIASRDVALQRIEGRIDQLAKTFAELKDDPAKLAILRDAVPLADLHEFNSLLQSITEPVLWSGTVLGAHVSDLRVPLEEIREFERILHRVAPPLLGGASLDLSPTTEDLRVPLAELREYEAVLDRVVEKARALPRLSSP